MQVSTAAGIGDCKGKGKSRLNVALDQGRHRLFLAVCNKDNIIISVRSGFTVTGGNGEHFARTYTVKSPLSVMYSYN